MNLRDVVQGNLKVKYANKSKKNPLSTIAEGISVYP
jgi:hypothetical protein